MGSDSSGALRGQVERGTRRAWPGFNKTSCFYDRLARCLLEHAEPSPTSDNASDALTRELSGFLFAAHAMPEATNPSTTDQAFGTTKLLAFRSHPRRRGDVAT
eukprot:8110796-Pyramimonas_sp.AAC.1